ncbi:R2-like ligand-binding oxidase [Deinococcus koreensis]|uniref:Ribonucleotide-diphosphate reductase n=1 Tax=Deinococcus koreensis TaxID=2054903 RepID=A0A2K3UT84_9DEIO|nr:R2-like ligand-binding oxidase [Deinococcus koreensis]PNY79755.1 ribonucleotide-diphosphate reductase [Deinococcus koreensis]
MTTPAVHLKAVQAGLNHSSLPMRLYHKAKRLGIWNPADLDFAQDARDWAGLDAPSQAMLGALTSLFVGGEEAVTLELLPLMLAVSRSGQTEEALYLTTFLFEEAKHTEFFERVQREVMTLQGDLSGWHGPAYRTVFYEELPGALGALLSDDSPLALARASTTYNMIVEGVLAETGYQAIRTMLQGRGLMPGVCQGITLLQRDESRHIAYGLHLLSRLIRQDEAVWPAIQARMDELLPHALGVIPETLGRPELDGAALRPDLDELIGYALSQFQKRVALLERAHAGQELDSDTEIAEI